MPKSNKTKDHKRPRARHRRAPKRAAVVADPRPLNRRVWPSLVAPILDHLLIERREIGWRTARRGPPARVPSAP